jgi:hypothetical protein
MRSSLIPGIIGVTAMSAVAGTIGVGSSNCGGVAVVAPEPGMLVLTALGFAIVWAFWDAWNRERRR